MVECYPKILREYLGEEREGSNVLIDKTTKNAAFIAGTSQRAQVQRLKDQSHTAVKKGHTTMKQ